jgi:hypothetical protein
MSKEMDQDAQITLTLQPIEAHWRRLENMASNGPMDEEQLRAYRSVFFSGAYTIVQGIKACAELPDDDPRALRWLRTITLECDAFLREQIKMVSELTN